VQEHTNLLDDGTIGGKAEPEVQQVIFFVCHKGFLSASCVIGIKDTKKGAT
jgi:hypothetical protein